MKELRDYRLEDDRPEMIKVASCWNCNSEIYHGDYAYKIDGVLYCEKCIRESREEMDIERFI